MTKVAYRLWVCIQNMALKGDRASAGISKQIGPEPHNQFTIKQLIFDKIGLHFFHGTIY